MQIGAQTRRTIIPELKPNYNTSKLNIEMQIEMKWYICSNKLQQFAQFATLKRKLR